MEVADYFDNKSDSDDDKVMVCGSPGEVSNTKTDGLIFDGYTGFYTVLNTRSYNRQFNRQYIWSMIALGASDQLRQRIAWAFAQVRFRFVNIQLNRVSIIHLLTNSTLLILGTDISDCEERTN